MAWVDGVASSGMTRGAQHRKLGDDACVVDCITDSGQGRWQRVKGLDHGQQ
jgi:hypothetical protein